MSDTIVQWTVAGEYKESMVFAEKFFRGCHCRQTRTASIR